MADGSKFRSLVISSPCMQVIHEVYRLCGVYEAVYTALTLGNLSPDPRLRKTRKGRTKSVHKESSKFNAEDLKFQNYISHKIPG